MSRAGRKRTVVAVTLDPETIVRIDEIAVRLDITRSALMDRMGQEYPMPRARKAEEA